MKLLLLITLFFLFDIGKIWAGLFSPSIKRNSDQLNLSPLSLGWEKNRVLGLGYHIKSKYNSYSPFVSYSFKNRFKLAFNYSKTKAQANYGTSYRVKWTDVKTRFMGAYLSKNQNHVIGFEKSKEVSRAKGYDDTINFYKLTKFNSSQLGYGYKNNNFYAGLLYASSLNTAEGYDPPRSSLNFRSQFIAFGLAYNNGKRSIEIYPAYDTKHGGKIVSEVVLTIGPIEFDLKMESNFYNKNKTSSFVDYYFQNGFHAGSFFKNSYYRPYQTAFIDNYAGFKLGYLFNKGDATLIYSTNTNTYLPERSINLNFSFFI